MSYPMSWNYRVVKQKHSNGTITFGIHQVFYDKNKVPDNCTDKPVQIVSDEEDEEEGTGIRWQLERMMEALDKPVLNYDEIVDIQVEKKRSEIISKLMKYSGYTEAEASFVAAIELGEISGDIQVVKDESELNEDYEP